MNKAARQRALKEFVRLSAEVRRFESASHFADWDQETMMPPRGIEARAELIGTLQGAMHERLTSSAFRKTLSSLCDPRSGEPDPGAPGVRRGRLLFAHPPAL